MATRGAILLSIGMLILGLILGALAGATAGFFAGQSMRFTVGRNFPQVAPLVPRNPNFQQPQPNNPAPTSPRRVLPPTQGVTNGAAVVQVEANSPASKAGLQVGDIITAVDNTPIDQNHSLADLIGAYKPGDKVSLTVLRNSQTLTLNVELGSTTQNAAYLGVRFAPTAPGVRPFQTPSGNSLPNG